MSNTHNIMSDVEMFQQAYAKCRLDECALPTKHGFLIENIEGYSKIKDLLDCEEFESAHQYLYNLDPDDMSDEDTDKVNRLYDVAVQRGFVGGQSNDEDGEEDEYDYSKEIYGDEMDDEEYKTPTPTPVDTPTPITDKIRPSDNTPLSIPDETKDAENDVPDEQGCTYTVLYSAIKKNGDIATGESYTTSGTIQAAKSDVIKKLSKLGYHDIKILAVEEGDCEAVEEDDEEQPTFENDFSDIADEEDDEDKKFFDENDMLRNRHHNAHIHESTKFDMENELKGTNEDTDEFIVDTDEMYDHIVSSARSRSMMSEDEFFADVDREDNQLTEEDEEGEDEEVEDTEDVSDESSEDTSDDTSDDLGDEDLGDDLDDDTELDDDMDEGDDGEESDDESSDDDLGLDDEGDDMEEDSGELDDEDDGTEEDSDEDIDSDEEEELGDDELDAEMDAMDEESEDDDESEEDDMEDELEDDDSEDDEDDEEVAKLTRKEKNELTTEYKTVFRNAMMKLRKYGIPFKDLTLDEKIEVQTEIVDKWGDKPDPVDFMKPKDIKDLEERKYRNKTK